MDEFYEYFKKLSNDITVLANDEADQLYSNDFPVMMQPSQS